MSMIYKLSILPDELAGRTLADPESIHELLESLQGSPDALSLENSWHGLHFLMTGDAWMRDPPLNFLTLGGEEVEDIDRLWPARILRAPAVTIIHEALEGFPDSNVDARLDLAAFRDAQIYPPIWGEPREALVREYKQFLQALKDHLRAAAQSHQALLATLQ